MLSSHFFRREGDTQHARCVTVIRLRKKDTTHARDAELGGRAISRKQVELPGTLSSGSSWRLKGIICVGSRLEPVIYDLRGTDGGRECECPSHSLVVKVPVSIHHDYRKPYERISAFVPSMERREAKWEAHLLRRMHG